MKVNLNEKDILTLVDLIDCDIREVRKGIKTIKEFPNKESLNLIDSLQDRIDMLDEIKEKLQNVE